LPTPSASATTAAATNEKIDPVTGLPIVDGGDRANPIDGNTSNADSRTPVVREGEIVKNWAELDALLGADTSYTECVSNTTDMNWSSDVPKFKSTESADNDPRYILAVNTTASDEAIRKIASDSTNEDLSGLKILRVDSIINTRGFTTGGCQEFLDRRSMVRVSLGKFVYNADGSVKGLQNGTGVFVDCHNPWRLPAIPPTTPPTTPTPTPTPTPTCPPTTCLEGKLHSNDVTPPPGVTPMGPGIHEPTAPAAPAAPMVPGTPPRSDTGTSAPVQGATPAPTPTVQPTTDPSVAPGPSDPGTGIPDPDA